MKRLCVVIINYRTVDLVMDCLKTLVQQLDHSCDKIVIVDNNSGGDNVERLADAIDNQGLSDIVTLVPALTNGGFSAGNNIGIQTDQAHFYLLTNSDTLFREDAIAELFNALESQPNASIISPRLEWPDGEAQISCFRFHSPISEFINSAKTGFITTALKRFNVPLDVRDDVSYPQWTSFACVLIKKEVFETIGPMDEGYFMYYEDVDFCRSAKNAGFELANWPSAHVVHLRGQSSGIKKQQKEKTRLPDYYYKSRARYFSKYYGRIGYFAANVCWTLGRLLSLLKEKGLRRAGSCPEKQHIDIWKK